MSETAYTTAALSAATLADFEDLFGRGNGWDHCACMYFQRGGSAPGCRTRAEARVRNFADKRALVAAGEAHGILVYAGARAVGWCQYGPSRELPVSGRRGVADGDAPDWRITCFVTDKAHRRAGVAGLALAAAIDAMGTSGGGVLEGYPVVQAPTWGALGTLRRAHGRNSPEMRAYLEEHGWPTVQVAGVGEVPMAAGSFGFNSTQGTVSMFRRSGFDAVGVVSGSVSRVGMALSPATAVHVRMQRNIEPAG